MDYPEQQEVTEHKYQIKTTMGFNETNMTINDTNNNMTIEELEESEYNNIINGYVIPSLAVFVFVINGVIIAVLRRQQTYGASQAGLISVAVSDTLTLILPAPFYFYSFGLRGYISSCEWLQTWDYVSLFFPTITHTASIWLTVVLTFQRYIYVCVPFKAKSWCTLRNTAIAIVVTYIAAVGVHLCRFFIFEFDYYNPLTNTTEEFCQRYQSSWIRDHQIESAFWSTYMAIRILFIQFVPCVCLILVNCKILQGLHDVTKRRMSMHKNAELNQATLQESNRVTFMIICMAAITILVEFPAGIVSLFHWLRYTFDLQVVEAKTVVEAEIVVNLAIVFSYPLNFLLYCSMSAEFKVTLKDLCLGVCELLPSCNECFNKKGMAKVPSSPPIYIDKSTNCA